MVRPDLPVRIEFRVCWVSNKPPLLARCLRGTVGGVADPPLGGRRCDQIGSRPHIHQYGCASEKSAHQPKRERIGNKFREAPGFAHDDNRCLSSIALTTASGWRVPSASAAIVTAFDAWLPEETAPGVGVCAADADDRLTCQFGPVRCQHNICAKYQVASPEVLHIAVVNFCCERVSPRSALSPLVSQARVSAWAESGQWSLPRPGRNGPPADGLQQILAAS